MDERYLVGLEHSGYVGSMEWIQRAEQLTDEELSVYNYLRNTEGQESADAYLDLMEETLNQRVGGKQAEDIANIENPLLGGLAAGGYGFLSGVDQFGSGVQQLFTEEALPTTCTQFGAAQVRENLADAGPRLPEWMGDRSLGQAVFEGTQMLGNMLPSVAVGSMAGGAGISANIAKALGSGVMGASAGGNAYNEAVKQVADAFGRLVNSGSLDSLVRDDRTVVQKILDAVRDMLNAIRRAVSGKGASLTEAQRSEFRDLEGRVAGMERLLQDALERTADLQGKTGNDTMAERYSVKGRYWRPDLTRPEWELLNRSMEREIGDPAHALDEATQWTYAEEKGVRVFAVYGVGDGTEATPLYAVGGKEAHSAYEFLMSEMEGIENGINGNGEGLSQWINRIRSKQKYGRRNSDASARAGTTSRGIDNLHDGASGGNTERIAGTGDQNEKVNTRFSLKSTDSQGRELTPEQQEFFKDSAIRIDEWGDYGTDDGPLVPVYHATWSDEFTVFDRQRLGENTDSNANDEVLAATAHLGFWFNTQNLTGRAGSRAEEVYLNITRPYDAGTLDGLADEIAYRTGDGTPSERGEEFRDWLQSLGYDGIIVQDREFGGTSFVAFDPEQIKRTTNRTPTSNPDIRFSRSNREQLEDYAALQRENELLRERVDYWRGQTRRTVSGAVDRKQVDRAARELIDAYGSELDADGIAGDLYALYNYMGTGRDGNDELTFTEARSRAEKIARKLVESASVLDDGAYREYAGLRYYLRNTTLSISEADSRNIADYGEFRRRNFGRMKLTRGRTNIEQVYRELSERWPELFDETRESNPADQLAHIGEVLDGIYQVTERNPFAAYFDPAVTDAANEILERFFDIPQVKKTLVLRFLFHADRLSYYYSHASHHCDREQRRRYRIQALMGENGLKGLDILTVASFLLGYENLMENRQQSAQNDVAAANDKQAEYLLRELSGRFEEQNAMLKEILEAVKK